MLQGPPGPSGSPGSAGERGLRGETGPQGVEGPQVSGLTCDTIGICIALQDNYQHLFILVGVKNSLSLWQGLEVRCPTSNLWTDKDVPVLLCSKVIVGVGRVGLTSMSFESISSPRL